MPSLRCRAYLVLLLVSALVPAQGPAFTLSFPNGVPTEVLRFVRTPDDEVGRRLVTTVDGVILTGSHETANLFRCWDPNLRLFAETSGKNALVVTPQADLDLAAADLVQSAFGHQGQKCSAASLGVLVGPVATDERFLRQVVDAAASLRVGSTDDPATTFGPLIGPAGGRLLEASPPWPRARSGCWSPGASTTKAGPGHRGSRPGSVPTRSSTAPRYSVRCWV